MLSSRPPPTSSFLCESFVLRGNIGTSFHPVKFFSSFASSWMLSSHELWKRRTPQGWPGPFLFPWHSSNLKWMGVDDTQFFNVGKQIEVQPCRSRYEIPTKALFWKWLRRTFHLWATPIYTAHSDQSFSTWWIVACWPNRLQRFFFWLFIEQLDNCNQNKGKHEIDSGHCPHKLSSSGSISYPY